MVKNSRAATRPGPIRPLNTPTPLKIDVDKNGKPERLWLQRQWQEVLEQLDSWCIDDEWWRQQPVCRTYFRLLLDDGRRVTVFQDAVTETWYLQNYA